VFGLDTTGPGGSLQASSRILLSQNEDCVACVTDAIAGPDGSLTAGEIKQGRQLVVRIAAGGAQTVLYDVKAVPAGDGASPILFADPSGRWVITWPPRNTSNGSWQSLRIGWIQDGRLVSMPGSTGVFANSIAWLAGGTVSRRHC
jgi:hypothetical protein